MARPSSKKVTRAAQTGGGRTSRGARPWLYWLVITVVVIAGSIGVAASRDQRLDEIASGPGAVAPLANKDHWHVAYGVYLCDQFAPPITDQKDPEGIHTHGDGVIHVHPFVRRAAGRNAQLERFAKAVKMDLSDVEIQLPGGKTFREGDTECDGKPGIMQLKVEGEEKVRTQDIADFVFSKDRLVITIAFAPKDAEIPTPPSKPTLDNLSDVESPTTIPSPEVSISTETSVEGSSDTTAPPSSDTTAP